MEILDKIPLLILKVRQIEFNRVNLIRLKDLRALNQLLEKGIRTRARPHFASFREGIESTVTIEILTNNVHFRVASLGEKRH